MQLKNIAMNDFKLLNKSIKEWEKFLSNSQADPTVKKLALFIMKLMALQKNLSDKKMYLNALEQLTAVMIVKNLSATNQENESFLQLNNFLTEQQVDSLNKNDLGTNFLRFLFASFYDGTEAKYLDILLANNPKSTILSYLGTILDDIKDTPVSKIIQDLACILAIEINNQQNDFHFVKELDARALALHFENISFFILLQKIENTSDLDVSYVEILKVNGQYFQNKYQSVTLSNFHLDLLTKGSTEEVLTEIMQKDEVFIQIVRSIAKAEELAK